MNLKFHLLLNIALAGILCLIGTTTFVLYRADREARRTTQLVADSLGKQLEFQRLRVDGGFEHPDRYPDLNLWQETNRAIPGICVEFSPSHGGSGRTVCYGAELPDERWPRWFEATYRRVFDPGEAYLRPIMSNGRNHGFLRVFQSPETELAGAWEKLSVLVKLSAATIFCVCVLVYAAIGRMLLPAGTIVSALEKMRTGNLDARVPAFHLLEWQRTGEAINELASSQQRLLSDRRMLSRKLVTLQEEERNHLARELHDESGQCLAASNAVATSILQTAKSECPSLVPEVENILRINRKILDGVHAMLGRLRPPELDEIGLSSCLESIVSEWNTRNRGKMQYRLEIRGSCDELPEPLPITLYRIVQECLTNIAKHSRARQVSVLLDIGAESVDLRVEDDGQPDDSADRDTQGVGLLGIRERVVALDGQLNLESPESGGFIVHATIPMQLLLKTAS